jgi:hypothetical protein
MEKIDAILTLPLGIVVRLMGCAMVSNGGKRAPGSDVDPSSEAELVRQLDEKARKAGAKI